MSIIWFDTINRLSLKVEPLTRAGYLPNKNYPVERVFDHMAFSYRTGSPDMELKIQLRDKSTVVTKDHCMLMLPGEYSITEPLKPCDELYFVFENPERLFGDKKPQRDEFGLSFPSEESIFFKYLALFKELLTYPLTPANCTQLDCLAHAILGCTFYSENIQITQSPIEKIEGYINSHYSEDIDFTDLASRFGLSFTTFRRLWNSRHNQPPGATIIELRNRHAKELLLNKQLSIGEVATLVGYPDTRYFSRFFKRCNNLSPGEFRQQNIHNEILNNNTMTK
jgi:two-component system response regulator YesN